MTIIQAIVLGIVQGLTEFLPVSSSGHLILVPELLHWPDQGLAFDVVVHLGTLLAVVIYFRKRLFSIVHSFVERGTDSQLNKRLGLLLILTVIPAGLFGIFAGDWIEQYGRSAKFVAVSLILWGVVLFIADRYNKSFDLAQDKKEKLVDINHMSWQKIAAIACAQAIALIPGTSRSGITMTAGLFAKLDKKSAAEFSFLMSVPIIALAGAVKTLQLFIGADGMVQVMPLMVGFFASFVSGFVAVAFLMKLLERWRFTPFVIYRIALGIVLLLVL